ncbi:hypothetical protein VARIO8X_90045 [Burkholderiales bacterium 8X]|nr:hypothetical protein VARIO8X_90045 [Burkholderiales bacterium 8X]
MRDAAFRRYCHSSFLAFEVTADSKTLGLWLASRSNQATPDQWASLLVGVRFEIRLRCFAMIGALQTLSLRLWLLSPSTWFKRTAK